jgi:hypothetical protein
VEEEERLDELRRRLRENLHRVVGGAARGRRFDLEHEQWLAVVAVAQPGDVNGAAGAGHGVFGVTRVAEGLAQEADALDQRL